MTYDPREDAALAVELFVPDVDEAVRWYTDVLGFELIRCEEQSGRPVFAIGALFGATLMFMWDRYYTGQRGELDWRGAGADFRVMVPDSDAVYRRARAAGASIKHDIGDRDYGLRDFIMADPFGFRLRFAAPLRASR